MQPADKKIKMEFQHEFFHRGDTTLVDGSYKFNEETLNIFKDYFQSEYDRMFEEYANLKNKPNNELIVYYHTDKSGNVAVINEEGKEPYKIKDLNKYLEENPNPVRGQVELIGRAFESQVFPSFSYKNTADSNLRFMYPDNGLFEASEKKQIESGVIPLTESIQDALSNRLIETRDGLISSGVINKNGSNNNVDTRIYEYYTTSRSGGRVSAGLTNMMSDYYVNATISQIEYAKLFTGDPAFYKNDIDFLKRVPATYTDGSYLNSRKGDPQHFNAAVIANVDIASKWYEELKDYLGEDIANLYKGKNNDAIDSTDAQAWITPARWKFILERAGKWN